MIATTYCKTHGDSVTAVDTLYGWRCLQCIIDHAAKSVGFKTVEFESLVKQDRKVALAVETLERLFNHDWLGHGAVITARNLIRDTIVRMSAL